MGAKSRFARCAGMERTSHGASGEYSVQSRSCLSDGIHELLRLVGVFSAASAGKVV